MRYGKRTIVLSEERDWPILRAVFRSGFITADQLFEFTEPEGASRTAFSNRLSRLVKNQLLTVHTDVAGLRKLVYCPTEACIQNLLIGGEFYGGRTGFENSLQGCYHALAINEVHLALRRSGHLVRWIPVTEICSRNDLTNEKYVKDYDGIAVMKVANREVPMAIEFERVMKTKSRYEAICTALAHERYVRILLYITPHVHIANYLHEKFGNTIGMNVCVCLFSEFQHDPWEARVRIATQKIELALRYALEFLPPPHQKDPLLATA